MLTTLVIWAQARKAKAFAEAARGKMAAEVAGQTGCDCGRPRDERQSRFFINIRARWCHQIGLLKPFGSIDGRINDRKAQMKLQLLHMWYNGIVIILGYVMWFEKHYSAG